jgi:hypothetical protein
MSRDFTYLDGSLEGGSVPSALAAAAQLRHSGYSSCAGMYSKYPVKHGRLRPVLYLSHAASLHGNIHC